MRLPRRRIDNQGFTIIEVMIVLAIAGLIMLIVFEALPALQRAGRNGQRKNDVATILQAVSHYELNDSGNYPQNCGDPSGHGSPAACASTDTSPQHQNDYFLRYVGNDLTFYNDANGDQVMLSSGPIASASGSISKVPSTNDFYDTSDNQVYIFNFEKCDPSQSGSAISTDADYRNVVALYALETGTSTVTAPQCQEISP